MMRGYHNGDHNGLEIKNKNSFYLLSPLHVIHEIVYSINSKKNKLINDNLIIFFIDFLMKSNFVKKKEIYNSF